MKEVDDLICDVSHYKNNGYYFKSAIDKGYTNPLRCVLYPHRPGVGTTFTINGRTAKGFESFSVNLATSRSEDLDDCELHYNPRLKKSWIWTNKVVVLNHRADKVWGPGVRLDSEYTEDFMFQLVIEFTANGYSMTVNDGTPVHYKRAREDKNRYNVKYLIIKGDCYIYDIKVEHLLCTANRNPKQQRCKKVSDGKNPPSYSELCCCFTIETNSQRRDDTYEERQIGTVRPTVQ